jgi:hypothetical protein
MRGVLAEPERVLVETRGWGQRRTSFEQASDHEGLKALNKCFQSDSDVSRRSRVEKITMAATEEKGNSLYCQKCKQPVRIDPSLEQLNPASYDLLVCVFSNCPSCLASG